MVALLPNQVYVKDDRGLTWIYDVVPEQWEIIKQHAVLDDDGNYVLSLPMVAAIKGWQSDAVISKVEQMIAENGIPNMPMPDNGVLSYNGNEKVLSIPNLDNCPNSKLEEFLVVYGGWRSYLESLVSRTEMKMVVLESGYEAAMNKAIFSLERKYAIGATRKPTKEALYGEALSTFPMLKKVKQELIETHALFVRLSGLRDQFKCLYDMVSRVVALRSQHRDAI